MTGPRGPPSSMRNPTSPPAANIQVGTTSPWAATEVPKETAAAATARAGATKVNVLERLRACLGSSVSISIRSVSQDLTRNVHRSSASSSSLQLKDWGRSSLDAPRSLTSPE